MSDYEVMNPKKKKKTLKFDGSKQKLLVNGKPYKGKVTLRGVKVIAPYSPKPRSHENR